MTADTTTRQSMASSPRSAGGSSSSRWSIPVLFAIWLVTQIAGIFSPPLLDDMDAFHVEAAREMLLRHDFVTLYVDGIRYLDKPPLPYWLGALSMGLFGQVDWAARLPLAFAALALTLWVYWLGRRLWSERAGFYSACVMATCVGPYLYTRFFIPDIMVTLWLTIAADLILRMTATAEAEGKARKWQAAAFAIVITLGLLTKGLIGIVFPIGLLLLWLLLTGRLKLLARLRAGLGAAVVLVTALPWHILATIQNPALGEAKGWFWFYFVNDQINRYLNKRIPRDYDTVPLVEFWLLLAAWVMPWCIYLVGAAAGWWKNRKSLRSQPEFLLLVWAVMIPLFFSFSTRQEYYSLPAVPALALLIGRFLAAEEREEDARFWGLRSAAVLGVVGLLVAIVAGFFGLTAGEPKPGLDLYHAITQRPEFYARSLGHIHDLTGESMAFFKWPLIGTAVSMLIGMVLAFVLRLRRRYYVANLLLAFAMCGFLACAHAAYQTFYPILGSEPLAQAINQKMQPGDQIVVDGQYSDAASIGFYTRQPLLMLNGRINNLWYGSLFLDAPHRFEDDASFQQLWAGAGRIYFVTSQDSQEWKRLRAGEYFPVATLADKLVVTNHPLTQ